MQPVRYDSERVLDLWQQGLKSAEIAAIIGAKRPSNVRNIVNRARRRGDPRAIQRMAANRPTLRERADRYGITVSALKAAIVRVVAEHDLFDAIFDGDAPA